MDKKPNSFNFRKEVDDFIRLKVKRISREKSIREDVKRLHDIPIIDPGKHLYYRLSMPFENAVSKIEQLKQKVDESRVSGVIKIRNLNLETDRERMQQLYNEIFMAAPDPSRDITLDEVGNFDEEMTYVALLGSTFVGFVMLAIEQDLVDPSITVGAIAGIGILARYRGKRIGLHLLMKAIKVLEKVGVKKLVCEVYEKNEPSLRMFQGLGMEITGYMVLEDEEIGSGR